MAAKKQILFWVLALVFAGFALSALAQGLIPCGTQRNAQGVVTNPCTPCDIFVLAQNILNFAWRWIAIPAAIAMLVYSGFLLIIPIFGGGQSANTLAKGKKVLTKTVVGILLLFMSWVIIDTVIKVLAQGGETIGSGAPAQIEGIGPWNRIECTVPTPTPSRTQTPTPTTGGTGGVGGILSPSATVATERIQAQALMTSLRSTGIQSINTRTRSSCGGVGAQTNADEIAAGRNLTVCSATCTATSGCSPRNDIAVNPALLVSLQSLRSSGYNFVITSIATGRHSANSDHYQGNSIDIQLIGPNIDYARARRAANDLATPNGGSAICERAGVTITSPLCGGADHIHISMPRRR